MINTKKTGSQGRVARCVPRTLLWPLDALIGTGGTIDWREFWVEIRDDEPKWTLFVSWRGALKVYLRIGHIKVERSTFKGSLFQRGIARQGGRGLEFKGSFP